MLFIRVNQYTLRTCNISTSYPGGTNKTSVAGLKTYIRGKRLNGIPARDIYNYCYYAPTQNAKRAETKLLGTCYGERNKQQRSNLRRTPGFVYVLSRTPRF